MDEVPCSKQNGPITGYLLTYTNTRFSDTINITGGENRSYTLTELRPYTNYTVTVSAYSDVGTGPPRDNRIQQTEQAGQLVYSLLVQLSEPGVCGVNLMSSGSDVDQIGITWNQPSMPNGIIIMYDTRYRDSDNSDSFVYIFYKWYNRHTIYHIRINKFHTLYHWKKSIHYCWSGEWKDIQASTLLPGISSVYKNIINILL